MNLSDLLNGFSSLISDSINGFISIILDFVIHIVELILSPFDMLIDNFFPDISNVTTKISDMLSVPLSYLGFILNSLGIDSFTLTLLVSSIVFVITLKLSIWVVKTALKWYDTLKT